MRASSRSCILTMETWHASTVLCLNSPKDSGNAYKLVNTGNIFDFRNVQVKAKGTEENALHGIYTINRTRGLRRLNASPGNRKVHVSERRIIPVFLRNHHCTEEKPLAIPARHTQVWVVRKNPNHEHERDDSALGGKHTKGKHLKDEIMELRKPKWWCRMEDLR